MTREINAPKLLGRFSAMLLALTVFSLLQARVASASFLEIVPQSLTLSPGDQVTVSVFFKSDVSFLLQATDLAVSYDSTRFSVSNVQLGSLDGAASGFSQTVGFPASGIPGIGEVTTSASTNTLGNQINPGDSGTLETFTLTVLATAPAGGGQIIIQEQFGNTHTSVEADANGRDIILVPPPTNSYNPTIDSTITVVPEPSSLVLIGLGGGLVAFNARLRKRFCRAARAA